MIQILFALCYLKKYLFNIWKYLFSKNEQPPIYLIFVESVRNIELKYCLRYKKILLLFLWQKAARCMSGSLLFLGNDIQILY